MKTKLFKSLTLSLLMLLGVGDLWAESAFSVQAGQTMYFDFTSADGQINGYKIIKVDGNQAGNWVGTSSFPNVLSVTFTQGFTIEQSNSFAEVQVKDGNTTYQISVCPNGCKLPIPNTFPDVVDCIVFDYSTRTFKWTKYSGTPAPEPEPEGDPAIDGCDGCYKITE